MRTAYSLTDLIREVAGWPIDIDAVAKCLDAADRVLPGGRDYRGEISDEQLCEMGYVVS